MRLAILSAPACPVVTGAWANGADPRGLPGGAFPEERVVRLPRRFSRMYPFQVARELGRAAS